MTGNENIFLSVGSVILQSPVFPGLEGNCVSLSCKNKNTSSHLLSDFYKDGLLIDNRLTGDMVSHSVSISDEGWHKCSISDVGEPHLKTVLPSKSALLKCNYPEHCFNCYFRILAVIIIIIILEFIFQLQMGGRNITVFNRETIFFSTFSYAQVPYMMFYFLFIGL